MTIVNSLFFCEPLSHHVFKSSLSQFSQHETDRIKKFHRWEDAHASLFGLLLLKKGLSKFNLPYDMGMLRRNAFGKPYLNIPIQFSISHSGNWVLCALSSETSVGVDIEQIREVDLDGFKFFFEKEWSTIQHSANRLKSFYECWTKKEAIIKADGRGFSVPLEKLELFNTSGYLEGIEYPLVTINLEDESYVANLATREKAQTFKINRYSPDKLISH